MKYRHITAGSYARVLLRFQTLKNETEKNKTPKKRPIFTYPSRTPEPMARMARRKPIFILLLDKLSLAAAW